jgi:hypothetical protein
LLGIEGNSIYPIGHEINPNILRTFAGSFDRHTRENGYPAFSTAYWIPACAGTTTQHFWQ